MPGRFPTLEDISLPNVQGARPVAGIDVSGYGRGAEALARSGQKFGSDIEQAASEAAAGDIAIKQKQVENGLMDLSTSYINNRNQFGLSNDPNAITDWQKANQDARNRFNAAVPGADTALGQHAAGKADLMGAEENLRVTERQHSLLSSQAQADTMQEIENLRNASSPATVDPSGRPDATREFQLDAIHGRIDQRVANGHLTPEQGQAYKQHAATQFVEAEVRSVIQAAKAESNPDRKEQLYALAADMMGGSLRNTAGRWTPTSAPALVSQAETGDPTLGPKALGNISPDSKGSRSYGFMGLNSASGSAAAFVRDYGAGLGITARPGTPQFDAQWKAAATNQTEAFRNAQLRYFNERIVPSVSGDLQRYGVPADIASDPRVVKYFVDRKVQMGDIALSNIEPAWRGAHGDVPTFLRNMNAIDGTPQQLQRNFSSAIASGVYGPEGHATRLQTRLEGALATPVAAPGASPPSGPAPTPGAPAYPRIDYTQPAELGQPEPPAGAKPAVLTTGGGAAAQPSPQPTSPSVVPQQAPPSGHPAAPLVRTALSPQQLDGLFRMIDVSRRADAIEQQRQEAASDRARKEASEDFYSKLFAATQLNPGEFPLTPADIISRGPAGSHEIDQTTVEKSLELYKANIKVSQREDHDTKEFGPAYWALLERIHPQDGHLAPITSASEIIDAYTEMGPSGDLTAAGAKKLQEILKESHESEDKESINRTKVAMLKYAEDKMAKMEDLGYGPVARNPKGRDLFNSVMVPRFEAEYSNWVKNPNHNPFEFLQKKNMDGLIDQVYPQARRDADFVSATGGATNRPPEAPGAALPEVPQGVEPKAWNDIVAAPPATTSGPGRHDDWAKVLNTLLEDPSPDVMAAFDAKFAPAGLNAIDVLRKLNPAAAIAAERTANLGVEGESEPGFDVTAAVPGAKTPAPPASYEERRAAAVTQAQQQYATRAQRSRELATQHAEAANEAAMRAGGAVTETPEEIGTRLERERLARIEQLKHEEQNLRAQHGPLGGVAAREIERVNAEREMLEKQVTPSRVEPNQPRMTLPSVDDELADLDRRETALKRSGLGGAFRQAQQRRIDERRAELMAQKSNK